MIKAALLKRPLIFFYIFTFVITWLVWLPLVIYYYTSPFEVSFSSVPVYLILLAFLGFFGPTIAGLIMTGIEKGGKGIRELLAKWLKFGVPVKWYLFIIISQVAIDFISIQITIHLFHSDVSINLGKWYNFVPLLLRTAFIGGAIAEETGWRGYALERTLNKTNALFSGLIIGVIWAVWHLPICLIPGANFPVPLSITVFMVFMINVICISIIMTTLYQNSKKSLFICYLYHVLLNVSLFSSIYKLADSESAWWIKICCSTGFHLIIAIFFIIVLGPEYLSRRQKSIINRNLK